MRKYLLIVVYGDKSIDIETYHDEDSLLDALSVLEKDYKGTATWEVYKHLSNPKAYLEKVKESGGRRH